MHTSGTGGQARGIFFLCFRPYTSPFTFIPACVGGRGCKRLATLGGGACGMHTSGKEGRARGDFFCVLPPLYFRIYPVVCGG